MGMSPRKQRVSLVDRGPRQVWEWTSRARGWSRSWITCLERPPWFFLFIYFILASSGLSSWRRKWQPTPVFLPENPMDKGAWWATVHRIAKSRTWLSDWTHTHIHLRLGCKRYCGFPLGCCVSLPLSSGGSCVVRSPMERPKLWGY